MPEPLVGLGVSAGLAVGPVVRMPETQLQPVGIQATVTVTVDPETERARVVAALEAVALDLERVAESAAAEARGVLQAEAMMARDPGLGDDIVRRVLEGNPAAAAVDAAMAVYREMLLGAGEYMAARVHDLDAVRDRVLANLAGVEIAGVPDPGHPFVLVATDLAPAETATLKPERVLALVTEEGGPTSHTAIIAKSLGVPAVVACAGATDLSDGTQVIVDGGAGTVRIDG